MSCISFRISYICWCSLLEKYSEVTAAIMYLTLFLSLKAQLMTCQLSITNLRLFLVMIWFSCSFLLKKLSPIMAISMLSKWISKKRDPPTKKTLSWSSWEPRPNENVVASVFWRMKLSKTYQTAPQKVLYPILSDSSSVNSSKSF